VVNLAIPPLRERPEDVRVLARHFLDRYAERFGTGPLEASGELLSRLEAYSWPGNVRELQNAIESMVALSGEGGLDLSLLPGASEAAGAPVAGGRLPLRQRVEAYERGLIVEGLEAAKGNRSEAARMMGISRVTLHDKLKKYGIGGADEEAEP
jgi:DNA-binding NtrC family response regulator